MSTMFQEVTAVFLSYPRVASAAGESKEERKTRRNAAYSEWAAKVWAEFRIDVGEALWKAAMPEKIDGGADAMHDAMLFVSAAGAHFSLFDTLCYYAGVDPEGYPTLWAARFAKILFDQNRRKDYELTAFAMRYVQAIKVARQFSAAAGDAEVRAEWESVARQFASSLSAAVKEMIGPSARNRWGRYARHYEVVLNGCETDLAEAFQRYRTEYYHGQHEQKDDILVAYAWTLHDSLSLAIRKFKNEKLVKLFRSEIAALPMDRLPHGEKGSIGDLLGADLTMAEQFFNGTLEAELYLRQQDVAKAIASYENALVRDSGNIEVRAALLHQYVVIARFGGVTGREGAKKPLVGDAYEKAKKIAEPVLTGELTILSAEAGARQGLLKALAEYLVVKARREKGLPYASAVGYVATFGTDLEKPFDEKAYVVRTSKSGRKIPAPVEVVCEALALCGLSVKHYGADCLVKSHPEIVRFCQMAQPALSYSPVRRRELGRLMSASGKFEQEARQILSGLLAEDLENAVSWEDLAESFPSSSEEAARCASRALCLDQDHGNSSIRAHETMASFYCAHQNLPAQACEWQRADEIRGRKKWRTRHGIALKSLLMLEKLKPTESNAADYANLSSLADGLVALPIEVCRGNVASARLESDGRIRILIKPEDDDKTELVEAKASGFQVDEDMAGQPVTVRVVRLPERRSVLQVESREGSLWDVYPRSLGIVIGVDESRGYVRMVTDCGAVSASRDRVPGLSEARLGESYGICLVRNQNGFKVVLGGRVDLPDPLPAFVKRVNGALSRQRGRRFGNVNDVFVPPSVCSMVADGDEVSVLAVRVPVYGKNRDGWQAVTLDKIFKEEVVPVLRG